MNNNNLTRDEKLELMEVLFKHVKTLEKGSDEELNCKVIFQKLFNTLGQS